MNSLPAQVFFDRLLMPACHNSFDKMPEICNSHATLIREGLLDNE